MFRNKSKEKFNKGLINPSPQPVQLRTRPDLRDFPIVRNELLKSNSSLKTFPSPNQSSTEKKPVSPNRMEDIINTVRQQWRNIKQSNKNLQFTDLQNKSQQYQCQPIPDSRIQLFQIEIERLNQVINFKNIEIDKLQNQNPNQNHIIRQLELTLEENEQLKQVIQRLQQQNAVNFEAHQESILQQHKNAVEKFVQDIQAEYQKSLEKMEEERRIFQKTLQDKNQFINELMNQKNTLQIMLDQKELDYDQFKSAQFFEQDAEIEIENLKKQIKDYELKFNMLVDQNNKQKFSLKQNQYGKENYLSIIEQQKIEINRLNLKLSQMQEIQQDQSEQIKFLQEQLDQIEFVG